MNEEDFIVPRRELRFHNRVGDWILKQARGDGISIMSEDWDNLVILDACRYDTFKRLSDLPGNLNCVKSQGTATNEFISENFHGGSFLDTVYISANAQVASHVEDGHMELFKLIGLWEDAELDGMGYLVHPETVLDQTAEALDRYPKKRFIIHFLQPHAPYVVRNGEFIEDIKYRYMDGAWRGLVSKEEITSIYEENVAYVLRWVNELLKLLSGKTIVTSDHGELLGENVPLRYKLLSGYWPLSQKDNYRLGHYPYIRVPELTDVPWLEIDSGTRRRIVEAEEPAARQLEVENENIEEHLKALGYV